MQLYPLSGHTAPTFTLQSDQNLPTSINDLSCKRGTLLVFVYGTYCPTCISTYMYLSKDSRKFADQDIGVAVVSLDDWKTSDIFKHSLGRDITFPILADEDGAIHRDYQCYEDKFCAVYIDANGVVRAELRSSTYPGTRTLLTMIDKATQRSAFVASN